MPSRLVHGSQNLSLDHQHSDQSDQYYHEIVTRQGLCLGSYHMRPGLSFVHAPFTSRNVIICHHDFDSEMPQNDNFNVELDGEPWYFGTNLKASQGPWPGHGQHDIQWQILLLWGAKTETKTETPRPKTKAITHKPKTSQNSFAVISRLWNTMKITGDNHLTKHVGIAQIWHQFAHAFGLGINHSSNHLFVSDGSTWPIPMPMPHPSGCRRQSVQPTYHWKRERWPWPCRQSPEHPWKGCWAANNLCLSHFSTNGHIIFKQPGIDFLHHRILMDTGKPTCLFIWPTSELRDLRSNHRYGSLYAGLTNSCTIPHFHKKTTLPQLWPIHSC